MAVLRHLSPAAALPQPRPRAPHAPPAAAPGRSRVARDARALVPRRRRCLRRHLSQISPEPTARVHNITPVPLGRYHHVAAQAPVAGRKGALSVLAAQERTRQRGDVHIDRLGQELRHQQRKRCHDRRCGVARRHHLASWSACCAPSHTRASVDEKGALAIVAAVELASPRQRLQRRAVRQEL